MVQVHVPARAWGFDSPPGHQPPLDTLKRGLVFLVEGPLCVLNQARLRQARQPWAPGALTKGP